MSLRALSQSKLRLPFRFSDARRQPLISRSPRPTPVSTSRSFSLAQSNMASSAPHPTTSTSDPAPPAEGINSITPGASAGSASKKAAQPSPQSKAASSKAPKEGKKDKKANGAADKEPLELSSPPEFFAERIKIYDEYKAKHDAWVKGGSERSML